VHGPERGARNPPFQSRVPYDCIGNWLFWIKGAFGSKQVVGADVLIVTARRTRRRPHGAGIFQGNTVAILRKAVKPVDLCRFLLIANQQYTHIAEHPPEWDFESNVVINQIRSSLGFVVTLKEILPGLVPNCDSIFGVFHSPPLGRCNGLMPSCPHMCALAVPHIVFLYEISVASSFA